MVVNLPLTLLFILYFLLASLFMHCVHDFSQVGQIVTDDVGKVLVFKKMVAILIEIATVEQNTSLILVCD